MQLINLCSTIMEVVPSATLINRRLLLVIDWTLFSQKVITLLNAVGN